MALVEGEVAGIREELGLLVEDIMEVALKLYSPFNLSLYETKPFTAFCTVLCVKEIVMNILISQMNLVELRVKVVSHSQLFYLPYFTRAIFFQGSYSKYYAQDNFQVSPLHICAYRQS